MPQTDIRPPAYKKQKGVQKEWGPFKKGLNLLLRPTELGTDELAQADNVMLVGSGVPTGRWGLLTYFSANLTGSNRGIGTYKQGVYDDVLALTDEGYLAKKNGSSSTQLTGQSWPSGTTVRMEQLGGSTYIVSPDRPLTSYAGTNLTVFATISPPTGLGATNFSGASGTNRLSSKVVALGAFGGQTTPSGNYVLTNLPGNLADTELRFAWTAPSAATYGGFEIYLGDEGDERWAATTPPGVTSYVYRGEPLSETIVAPITNTTGGIKSPFIKKYKDRLLFVDADDKTKLVVSGRYPNQTKTNWADGGGYIYIDPDSGDDITGIEIQPIADRIVVYKNNSSYLVELSTVTIGNYVVLDPQYQPISTAVGCSNQDTIATVENDTFYFGRNGVYVTGYEPNFLNIIRTNETSAKIRPYLEQLNAEDYATANAIYINNKYLLSFPQRKELMVYDRERGCWYGPWIFPFGISHMEKHIDSSGTEKWIVGSAADNQLYTFDMNTNSDNGVTITKTLRTNKDYMDDWTLLNIIQFFYVLMRAVVGSVTVNILIEDRSGNTSTAKTFTITGSEVAGSTGWGMDTFGSVKWGQTNSFSVVSGGEEITRWGSLFKQARLVQIEVVANSANSNFELLQIRVNAAKQSSGSLSSTQRV